MDRNLSKLSILIPCFNEKKTINKIFEEVEKSLIKNKFLNYEIIIIDDCSSDGTVELLQNIEKKVNVSVFYHKTNLGKGSSIHTGLKNITGDIVIIQDADLEYDPADYKKLMKPLLNKKNLVVYGSRVLKKKRYASHNFTSTLRIFFNHVLTIISNLINQQNLTDAHTCYKMFDSNLFKKIRLRENGFAFCPEVTTKISNLKVNIIELPISYKGRSFKEGKKISFIDGIEALIALFKYKFFTK